ncbi:adenylate kinase [Mycobacterium shimoidei]|jgi:adenylate kinase family enzyme|uniref:Adenylate kinase [Rothia dentocariosa ATCC] n=1 Tax=Mycobacterium shimoidei TaxID=29313 RepID=A0A1E3TJM9_MYCSH|nr:adenylate kinase [Mycobacterium shimoidei]MCV7259480.1 adenylate kinase [Mycobacterium shimoidei]ODR14651.1 adenylate kinase [Mycobacterium shimoidei]ORW81015.1 adenylate kinase [Mycobacterium shimoidei]SRX93321.1 adenylate kinase [Rothia dentocariosa ATCC] [Mycobacterium shimoidei]
MKRVVVLGRGGAGKSILAAKLGSITGLPVVELDKYFWAPDLTPMGPDQWTALQQKLVHDDRWILDGDLGEYDVLTERLRAADTVIVLDFSLWRCVWQAARRSRQKLEFWRWVICYRRRSLPRITAAIAADASYADVHVLRNPRESRQFLAHVERSSRM